MTLQAQLARLKDNCASIQSSVRRSRAALDQAQRLLRDTQAAVAAPTPATISWRLRMLLLAMGSTTIDGSDLTASDRQVLAVIDRRLRDLEAENGLAAAENALLEIVEVLETSGGSLQSLATRH